MKGILGTWSVGFVAAVLSLLFLPAILPAQPVPLTGLDDYVEQVRSMWEVPGIAIAVVKDDAIIHAKGYGLRRLGTSEPVSEHTVFAIGSNSKTFTSAGIAMLVDEGLVKWDDKVIDRLSDFRTSDPYVTQELTIRDLLTHRSGTSRDDNSWLGRTNLDRHELLRRIRFLKQRESFRAEWRYNNFMFLTAGGVIEEVSGLTWDAFVEQRMFTPLGMMMSNTSVRDLQDLTDVASPHANIDGQVMPVKWRNIDNMAPAGSINSNVVDMAQWIRMQLGDGMFDGRELISASEVKEMHTPQMAMRREGIWGALTPESHFMAYGLGWFLFDYRDHLVVLHGGNIDGMSSLMAILPEANAGAVLLTNMNQSYAHVPILYRIIDLILAAPERDWNEEYLAFLRQSEQQQEQQRRQLEASRVQGTSPSLSLEAYAGSYADPDSLYGKAEATVENGRLVIRNGDSWVADLEHWHYDTFRAVWRDRIRGEDIVRFSLDVSGQVATMDIGDLTEFARISHAKDVARSEADLRE